MNEKMNESYEELKRVEHLIYVSLKYTRTVDVILNILTRMTDGYALMVDALIEYEVEQGKVTVEPESIIERATLIKQVFSNDDVVVDNMELYLLLRKLLRAKNVERENEYRRYVTMKTVVDGREEIVTIDIITNYCLYQREFFSHVRTIIEGKSAVEVVQQAMEQPQAPAWMRESAVRENEDALEEEINKSTKTNSPPPPTKQPMKVRPVTAPPRKRAPRPKKYKIQIPKGKNAIMTPEYMPVIRAAIEAEKQKKVAAAMKVAAKSAAKAAAKADFVKKSGVKSAAKARKVAKSAKVTKAPAKKSKAPAKTAKPAKPAKATKSAKPAKAGKKAFVKKKR